MNEFFREGLFDWQKNRSVWEGWAQKTYDEQRYWGDFPRPKIDWPDWVIRFEKEPANPVFGPSEKGWDCGHTSGGVHNGSVLKKDGMFYYFYRGEQPWQGASAKGDPLVSCFDYICDIGIAQSRDGLRFERLTPKSGLFRHGADDAFSFEDVCLVQGEEGYFLFCNRWDWSDPLNPRKNGVFLAVSADLKHWEKKGLVFPQAGRIHRNACVVQDLDNRAVRLNGRYVMYLNDGLMATSSDLLRWESREIGIRWPGGEGCAAITGEAPGFPQLKDHILLFTGGHHTGHFYAVGEVLFDVKDPSVPLEVCPCPVLFADPALPHESGRNALPPHEPVSGWRDTVFFTGLTGVGDRIFLYYGGSEYYACLARSLPAGR